MMKAALKEEQFLIFRVGLVACCVPIESIDSVVRAHSQELHHFPNQASYISGVIQHRGKAISIVNLFHKFAQTPSGDEPGDYILSQTKYGLVGFWVNEVLDIVNTTDEDWGASPKFLGENIFHQTLLWHDKLILQSEFDRLIAMNDSERLHEWAIQNHSELFHQVAANSDFDEPEDSKNTDHIKSEDQDQSDTVSQLSQPVSVNVLNKSIINNAVETDTETNFESALSAIEQDLDAQTSASYVELATTKLADADINSSAIEDKNSVVEQTLDNDIVENSEPIKTHTETDSNSVSAEETAVAPGFTEFMAGSSVASDFDATVYSASAIEEHAKENQLTLENNSPKQSKSVAKISKSMTEILSLQTNFDEDSVHESAFTEIEKLVTDDEKSSAKVIEQKREIETTVPPAAENQQDIKTTDKILNIDAEKNKIKESSQLGISSINDFKEDDSIVHIINDYISNSESGFQETNDDDSLNEDFESAMAEKREASIRKVINRIEEKNPEKPGGNRFRLVVSVIIAASAVFFVQHYYMNGEGSLFSDPRTIELLADNNIETVANSQSILNIVESNVASSVVETKEILPILPIPLSQSVQQSKTPAPVFPWRKHVVNRGDTLWDLSEYYLNNPFRYPELARWSNIKNPDLIYPGDEVKYQDDQGVEEQSYKKQ